MLPRPCSLEDDECHRDRQAAGIQEQVEAESSGMRSRAGEVLPHETEFQSDLHQPRPEERHNPVEVESVAALTNCTNNAAEWTDTR